MTEGNSARNFRKGDYSRSEDDWYVEPAWCVEQLADAVDFGSDTIWDPCCGGGTIPDVFRARGHDALGTDLVDRGAALFQGVSNFLADPPPVVVAHAFQWPVSIVMNPPFKHAEGFVRCALALPVHRVCIVQQLSFLASARRFQLYAEHTPSDVLILSKRPSMPPGRMIAEMGERAFGGGTTDYAWTVWERGHAGDTRLRWLPPFVAAAEPLPLFASTGVDAV